MKFDDENFGRDDSGREDYSIEDVSSNADDNVFDLNSFANMKLEPSDRGAKGRRTKRGKIFATADSNDPKAKRRNIIKIALSCFLVFVITACIVLASFLIYVFGIIDPTVDEDLNDLALNFTTTIYVKDSKTGDYSEYQRLHGEYNRIWVGYNREQAEAKDPEYTGIPYYMAQAFVAIEDKRFYEHEGVDWRRTISAFVNMILPTSDSRYGGSTITQQLVKNLTGDNDRSSMRKIREIMRARYLESKYYKDTIIECYMNTVAMGKGMYGVEVASNYYFSKSVNELTLAECACLAAIVKGPTLYRPDNQPEANKERRETVLYEMYDQGRITKEEYDAAVAEKVVITADEEALKENEINSYFVDAIIDEVINDLSVKYDYDETHAALNFYNGGYKIYCTMDPKVQEAVEDVFTDKSNIKISSKSKKQLQGAITVMDYKGHVVGIAGGLGEKTGNRVLNRATAQPRQPGSSIKPLSAYAPALENNLITYSSIVNDVTKKYGGWPVRGTMGKVTVAKAVEKSLNTIPVELINKMTPQASFDFLTQKLGFKNFHPTEDVNLSSLGLGGSHFGVTTLEEASAFAIFGNGGMYYEPTTYEYITDQHGEVIFDNRDRRGEAVISEDTSFIMNKLLQNVVYGSSGTGRIAASSVTNMKLFGKTGTTDNVENKWFTGGSPYYVASCWVGFDQAEKVADSNLAIRMWSSVMKKINSDKKPITYEESEYVTCRLYCTETGLIAKADCPTTAVGWYKTGYMPSCNKHAGAVTGEHSGTVSSETSSTTSAVTSTNPTSSTETSSNTSSTASDGSSSSNVSSEDSTATSSVTPAETE